MNEQRCAHREAGRGTAEGALARSRRAREGGSRMANHNKKLTPREQIIAIVGAICGGSPLEDGEETKCASTFTASHVYTPVTPPAAPPAGECAHLCVRSRRRLILGEEEEPLPDIPEPQRAPYISPTLAQVTPLEGASLVTPMIASGAMSAPPVAPSPRNQPFTTVDLTSAASHAVPDEPPKPAPRQQPLATLDLVSAVVGAGTSAASADAPAEDEASSMEDIMAQVLALPRPRAKRAGSGQPPRSARLTPHPTTLVRRWPGWRSRGCSFRRPRSWHERSAPPVVQRIINMPNRGDSMNEARMTFDGRTCLLRSARRATES